MLLREGKECTLSSLHLILYVDGIFVGRGEHLGRELDQVATEGFLRHNHGVVLEVGRTDDTVGEVDEEGHPPDLIQLAITL